eukprot:TRINITY_DN32527_c0_g1_i2.p1 TRINITY_DN32527_c0_g1~~TRINITY_DN32527_c0_g1_i2.p1  ORF type:complete len:305 (+),score=87.95 TRINITY_DN32527_c0_g1_i2:321-1235(+)
MQPEGAVNQEVREGVFSAYRHLASGEDPTAKLPPCCFLPHNGPVTTLCFSNVSGRYLAYGGVEAACFSIADLSLPFDDAATRKIQLVWTDKYGGSRHLSFSPDDSVLLFTTSHRPLLVLYDTATWKEKECYFTGPVCRPQWHGSGHLLFYLQEGSTVICMRLWSDVRSTEGGAARELKPAIVMCEHLEDYKAHLGAQRPAGTGAIRNLALDPTGSRLAVLLYDGLLAVYRVQTSLAGQPSEVELKPLGLAKLHHDAGSEAIFPVKLAFARCVATGAVLSAVWGDGLMTMLPLRFGGCNRDDTRA